MYPEGMEFLQSNWTPRSCRLDGVNKIVFVGLQAFIMDVLEDKFNRDFFKVSPSLVIEEHRKRVEGLLGQPFDVQHWYDLWDLGYLPLRISALPEGTEVPLRVPMFIIENTLPGYGWLVNYFESVLSNNIWQGMTSATIALRLRRLLDSYAAETSDTPEFVDWQGHDFSFRGLASTEAAAYSGFGHLLSFAGTDTLPAMDFAQQFYNAPGFIGGSVPATEHSVMCAGGKDDELETFNRLLTQFPEGILSVVSDTWDLWEVITVILPQLKSQIMDRNGKLVIRPDSGNPVDILCGKEEIAKVADRRYLTPEQKGVVELLYEIFPGPTNSKGYKTLDPHIGTIYGDAITYDVARQICERLKAKGFATTNVVLGVGSFTYQYNTRDTCGFAMKATHCQIDGKGYDLYKDPITDSGVKKSAKGRLAVIKDNNGELILVNCATPNIEAQSLLQPIWEDGKFLQLTTFRQISQRIGVRKLLPT
jgi:nicotinamide phosphoribosyltransferase